MEVSVDDFCTNFFLVDDVCLEEPTDIEHDARGDEDAPDEVVDCAIMVPSPFLSEGVMSMKDEPHVDVPQIMIDEPHPSVEKLQVLCVPCTPSFKISLEEIQLFEYDGAYRGKKGKESMKRKAHM